MPSIDALECALKRALGWHKPRARCPVQIVLGLTAAQSVDLKELACTIAGTAHLDSHYRRLQRFFPEVSFPHRVVAYSVAALFLPDRPMVLSIHRTNWQWGQSNINVNVLVLGACYRGVAMPLYRMALPKGGNSAAAERIRSLERFCHGFGVGRILGVGGDRALIGDRRFAYLRRRRISFDRRAKRIVSRQIAEV